MEIKVGLKKFNKDNNQKEVTKPEIKGKRNRNLLMAIFLKTLIKVTLIWCFCSDYFSKSREIE